MFYSKSSAILSLIILSAMISCRTKEADTAEELRWSPSDDPADYNVDTSVEYSVFFEGPDWIIPADNLPSEITTQASNNNVDIHLFDGQLFVAWRSSPNHFASPDSQMWVMSSEDMGETWKFEGEFAVEADLREPRFLSMNGELQLSFFEAGDNPLAFEPKRLWRSWKTEAGWSELEEFGEPEMVMWDIKVRSGRAYMTTYTGEHYGEGDVFIQFWVSDDGRNWEKQDGKDHVYAGGLSEVAFEFDAEGNLWAVGRNEDGDSTGAGSQLCFASKDELSNWLCLENSDPERTDSPEMFRHGDDIYLLARKDIGGPFGPEGNLLAYSARPKAFSLYQIDTEAHQIVWLEDLPGVGDTAFPSVRRLSEHEFLFANYTSPLDDPDITWLQGQSSSLGTDIYLGTLRFEAE